MKRIIYFLLLLIALSSCKEEESGFQPSVGTEAFSFKPISGGAIMHYTLPADKDIMGLNIRYKDFQGKSILRSASSLSDSLELLGFNEAKQNVPAEVRLVKRNGDESAPIAVEFSTEDSGPYAFIDRTKVMSGWNGFTLTVDNPTNVKGMAHVFYLGKNPMNGEPDTILINTFPITAGKDTMNFSLKQKAEKNTIIIRTEDYRGYMVREKSYPNIQAFNTQKLDPSEFDFYFDKSIENPSRGLGSDRLFNGDLKGTDYFTDGTGETMVNQSNFYTFVAGPDAIGEPMYIDMHKNRMTAEVRFYAMAKIGRYFYGYDLPAGKVFYYSYYLDKLPCNVDVYAAKDDNGTASNWEEKQWVKVASYKQSPNVSPSQRWCVNCVLDNTKSNTTLNTLAEAQEADPIYMTAALLCDGQDEGYRYLKIIVNDTFKYQSTEANYSFANTLNAANYFTLQQLEVYTKKEGE